jgi:hypothetical protein
VVFEIINGVISCYEFVGKIQIYTGTLVSSQYDHFEGRGIDFSENAISNQVFRSLQFLQFFKKTLFLTYNANFLRN